MSIKSWFKKRHERYLYHRWADNLKIGSRVCDCIGEHVEILEFDAQDADLIMTTNGGWCSISMCCHQPRKDEKCHEFILLNDIDDIRDW